MDEHRQTSKTGSAGKLRYRALVEALVAIRGPDHFESIAPSEDGVFYRPISRAGIAPRVDVYLPQRHRTGASVVLVHGGGFVIGARAMKPMRFLAARLVAAGVSVCSVDYRLIFRGGRLDEALDDVHTAFDFWRSRARRYGLDAARVSLVGLSAGGTLSTLVAAREPSVSRLVSAFGLYELDHLRGPLASAVPRLLFRTQDRHAWAERSPRGAASPGAPMLLLHGTADGLVPVEQAERFAAHREALGLPTRLVLYPDAPHGFFNMPNPAAEAATREIVAHVA